MTQFDNPFPKMIHLIFAVVMGILPASMVNATGVLASNTGAPADTLAYFDGLSLDVIGKYHKEAHWGRLPARYEKTVREQVWRLGQNSAGIGIRFRTNASTIAVRWTVMNGTDLKHMPATGVRGVDLYALVNDRWQYVKTGFPSDMTTETILLSSGEGQQTEYLLNLPLYDGVRSIEIGINKSAVITGAQQKNLVTGKPVVYYGTSIAQGGCASRPGLAFTNILARRLNRQFINLGFSGNGTIETSVGEAMSEIDAAVYVIDCNANTTADLIYERTIALVRLLREKHPQTPILLVENFFHQSFLLTPAAGVTQTVIDKRKELRRAYEELRKGDVPHLHYKTGDNLIGSDHEGTVDGVHPNDLGMVRIADELFPVFKKIL
jgi:lysophospholipase L1-like esterase